MNNQTVKVSKEELSLQTALRASERLAAEEGLTKNLRKKLRKKRRRLYGKATPAEEGSQQQDTDSDSAPVAAPSKRSQPSPEPQASVNASTNSHHAAHTGQHLVVPGGWASSTQQQHPHSLLQQQQQQKHGATAKPTVLPPMAAGMRAGSIHPSLQRRGHADMSLLLKALKGAHAVEAAAAAASEQGAASGVLQHGTAGGELPQAGSRKRPRADVTAEEDHHQQQQQRQQQVRGSSPAAAVVDARCREDLSGEAVLLSAALSGSQLGAALLAGGSCSTASGCSREGKRKSKRKQQAQQQGHRQQQEQGHRQQQPAGQQAKLGVQGQDQGATAGAAADGVTGDQQQQQQEGGQAPSRKRTRRSYVYGNYHGYYGYRLGGPDHQDPRLQVLSPEWVKGADCLDIGCNEGLVTLALVTQLQARSAVGVDIDRALIAKACEHLQRVHHETSEELREAIHARNLGQRHSNLTDLQRRHKGLGRVTFRHAEWLALPTPRGKYDLVTCLSVTKWVHLHQGDDGLMRLFNKMFQCLAPGGLLVLEPQPWSSYHTAVHKQDMRDVPYRKYEQLKLRPEGFMQYLTQRVGFELLAELHPGPAADAPATAAQGKKARKQQQRQHEKQGMQEQQQQEQTMRQEETAGAPGKEHKQQQQQQQQQDEEDQQQDKQREGEGKAPSGKPAPKSGFDRPVWVLRKPLGRH